MTDTKHALSDDIAFMRGLAEAGRDRPMVGGATMVAAGLIFGTASLILWWLVTQRGMDGLVYPAVWMGAFVLYMAVLFPLLRALPRTAGTMQAATGVAWSAMGWSIFFLVVSLGIVSYRLGDGRLMITMPAILTALYGGAWFVPAILMRQRWLMGVAIGSFAMSLVNAWFVADGKTVWLAYAATLYLLMALPGLVLVRQARRAA